MNHDRRVNLYDALDVALHFGRRSSQYDVNGDGRVDVSDIVAVLACMPREHHDGHRLGHYDDD